MSGSKSFTYLASLNFGGSYPLLESGFIRWSWNCYKWGSNRNAFFPGTSEVGARTSSWLASTFSSFLILEAVISFHGQEAIDVVIVLAEKFFEALGKSYGFFFCLAAGADSRSSSSPKRSLMRWASRLALGCWAGIVSTADASSVTGGILFAALSWMGWWQLYRNIFLKSPCWYCWVNIFSSGSGSSDDSLIGNP